MIMTKTKWMLTHLLLPPLVVVLRGDGVGDENVDRHPGLRLQPNSPHSLAREVLAVRKLGQCSLVKK